MYYSKLHFIGIKSVYFGLLKLTNSLIMHCFVLLQCFYIGARADSATSTIGDITKPMSFHKPVEKICQVLNKKDSQICELKYGKKCDPWYKVGSDSVL